MNYSKKISSLIGDLYLVANDHALIALDKVSNDLYVKATKSEIHKILNLAHQQLEEYFNGRRVEFDCYDDQRIR